MAEFIKHIPGLRIAALELTIAKLRSFGKAHAKRYKRAAGDVNTWIRKKYGHDSEAFWDDWKWLRVGVELQVRLFVEAVLWERGGEWRRMITGFSPARKASKAPAKPQPSGLIKRPLRRRAPERRFGY